jgi:hypothetical protein
MFRASRAAGTLAVTLVLGAVAGCGGGQSLAALENPGTPGVEALRQALQSALRTYDNKQQCELLTPALIADHGGSIDACARILSQESGPYSQSIARYAAGGRIELLGNEAIYQPPPGSITFNEGEASYGYSASPVFTAIYTEGAWRITENRE